MLSRCLLAALLWTAARDFGIIRGPILYRLSIALAASMNSFSQTLGLAISWLMVAWVMLHAMVVAVKSAVGRSQRKLRHLAEKEDFCRRVEATARAARASKAIFDWSGWRPFRVSAVVDEASDVKSFYLTPENGQPLAPFGPGQYLTFRLPVPGCAAPLVRCYSLSDRPRQDYYRVTIKRVSFADKDGVRAVGRGSSYFHEHVHVGDLLDVRAPAGTFMIDPLAAEPIALIGAGIGITPLVSMLEAILRSDRKREVHAIFGFRNSGEHPFKDRLATIAAENPNVRLHASYSAPLEHDVQYRDYSHAGRVTLERVREVLPSNNFRFYLCGPGQLMESLVPALWEWGVPESHVNFEAFGPASVKSARHAASQVQPCNVRFERSGTSATWDGSLNSLLEFGEAAGVKLISGCRAGSCGECLTAIRSGDVETIKDPGIAVPAEHCLTCISVPTADLVLDA